MKKPDPSTHLHLTLCPTPFFLPFLPSPHSVSAKSFFSSSFERALRAEPKVGGKEGRKNLLGPMGTLRNLSFIHSRCWPHCFLRSESFIAVSSGFPSTVFVPFSEQWEAPKGNSIKMPSTNLQTSFHSIHSKSQVQFHRTCIARGLIFDPLLSTVLHRFCLQSGCDHSAFCKPFVILLT